ncbi:biogenesis of lysosome-related organelles complex-1 subunit 2 domain-containing protein [Ditylenchus destructor]|uniref:Biogenesis of lysosome-related organelles complex-1 subunit 2 domain-containing protein n=1 Tax=Ditylenchus destructor TaxID=166010 RepID=A0AAD4R6Q8_9BILA|nr:biogenesis of lysosome-related organelles complex-1 subunit 2 domain-containing protein [Ditylenchus destructor]
MIELYMAEINERASTSVDCPMSPVSTVSDEVHKLAENAADKVYSFVQGQIQSTIDDYKVLENMNNVTAQRYSDMKQVAETISSRLSLLHQKYEDIQPYLQQIDEIDTASRRMEEAVTALETYLNTIETKLKKTQQNTPST